MFSNFGIDDFLDQFPKSFGPKQSVQKVTHPESDAFFGNFVDPKMCHFLVRQCSNNFYIQKISNLQVEFELVLVISFSRLSVNFTTPFLAAFDIKSITSEWDNPVTGFSSTAINISPRCIIPFSCAAPPLKLFLKTILKFDTHLQQYFRLLLLDLLNHQKVF